MTRPAAPGPAMAAEIADEQVAYWRQGPFSGTTLIRMRRHIAEQLGCYPSWDEIRAAIVRRLLDDAEPLKLAA